MTDEKCSQENPLRCDYPHCSCMPQKFGQGKTARGVAFSTKAAGVGMLGLLLVIGLLVFSTYVLGNSNPPGPLAEVTPVNTDLPRVTVEARLWGGIHNNSYKEVKLIRYGNGPWVVYNGAGQVLGEQTRVAPYANPLDATPVEVPKNMR